MRNHVEQQFTTQQNKQINICLTALYYRQGGDGCLNPRKFCSNRSPATGNGTKLN